MKAEHQALKALVATRRARGMTQSQVARRLYVTPAAVSLLEGRLRRGGSITLARLAAYADALDADLRVEVVPR